MYILSLFFLGRGVTLFVFLRRKNIPSMLKRELVVVVFEESTNTNQGKDKKKFVPISFSFG